MPKQKSKKEVHQPDDKLFKEVMKKKEGAAQYLKSYFPELAAQINLESLEIIPEAFSIPNLKTFDADIVYRCQYKDSDENLYVSFLWENKSEPEEFIAIQIGLYLFLSYYRMVKDKKQKLEPIIPLVFYNGKQDWTPKNVFQLFENHKFFATFKTFLPNFDFNFTNVRNIPREELLQIEMAFFKSAMFAMANKHDYNLMFREFEVIFDLDDSDEQISMSHYVFGIFERLPEKIKKEIQFLPPKIMNTIMSTLAILRKEGRVEGKIERDKELVILMYKRGKSIEEIMDLLEVKKEFVLDVTTNIPK